MYSILEWFEVDMDKNELLKFETHIPLDFFQHFKKQVNKFKKIEETDFQTLKIKLN